jgi:hypothetical protein
MEQSETEGDERTDLVQRAREIIDTADERGVDLRLVGSVGFRALSENPSVHAEVFEREIGDIDLVGRSADSEEIQTIFEELGYEIDKDLLLAGWGDRYVFYGTDHEVDVFLDKVSMCHTLDLRDRLTLGPSPYSLTPADLLLEKAQIVEINEKDLKDMTFLFAERDLTDDETGVNQEYIAERLAGDWGFYNTFTTNVHKLQHYLERSPLDEAEREAVRAKIDALLERVQSEPKSIRWQARAKLGERIKWYDDVEEKHR